MRAIHEKEKEMMDEILKKAKLEELSNIPEDNEVEPTSSEETCNDNEIELTSNGACNDDSEDVLCNNPNENEVEPTSEDICILSSAIGKLDELCNIPNDNGVEPTSGETCNDNEVEPNSEEAFILRSAIGKLEEFCIIPDLSEVELASEEVSHVSRDELEQEAKQEELMKLIYEKEKSMMEKILTKVESSSCNNEEEAFNHQLQLVIKDSISKYFQSLSSGGGATSTSSSEEGQMAGLKISLPWRLQLKNNWHQSKEKPIIEDLKAAGDDRLEIELPMMVGCYQYHLLINGVAFCDRGRSYRRDDEDFGDFVNFFTLWSELPLPAWPGLRMSTKLDFPFKVELSGSWGEQVAECTMNPDGTLGAHLPSLCPGVYHPSNLSDRFKLSEAEEPAAKMCPEVEEPEDEEAAKMWPNKDEEDEGYDTIRKRGRSQKVAKN